MFSESSGGGGDNRTSGQTKEKVWILEGGQLGLGEVKSLEKVKRMLGKVCGGSVGLEEEGLSSGGGRLRRLSKGERPLQRAGEREQAGTAADGPQFISVLTDAQFDL